MAEQRTAEGLTPKESNLPLFHKIKKLKFNAIDEATQAEYEARADAHNLKLIAPPSPDHIYTFVHSSSLCCTSLCSSRNQETVVDDVMTIMGGLCGWGWKQYGDIAFFVEAAYRDKDGKLQMFK